MSQRILIHVRGAYPNARTKLNADFMPPYRVKDATIYSHGISSINDENDHALRVRAV